MKNLLKSAVVDGGKENYISLLIILAPLLNFLSGITFDLHAPSIPAIASYFNAPVSAAKNTITFSLLGFSIGCILFGTLLDIFGRRPIILIGLVIYTVVSFSALACGSINELLLVRFAQGFAVSCLSIGCRAIIIDKFTGHQFKVAILYTSLAFSIGPIVAPFVGGILQFHFGWKANFITYGIVSLVLMVIFALYVDESKEVKAVFSLKNALTNYIDVLRHAAFVPGVVIAALSQIQLLVYTTVGALLIESVLHRSAITYGNSALIISCGYLFGTLTNRFLIKDVRTHHLVKLGFALLLVGILSQLVFHFLGLFNLFTIVFPITLIGFSNGFIFINVFTSCLRFITSAGVATALFTAASMAISTLGTFIISHLTVSNLAHLAVIFGVSVSLQLVTFFLFFQDVVKRES
jgi:MFS family permease